MLHSCENLNLSEYVGKFAISAFNFMYGIYLIVNMIQLAK